MVSERSARSAGARGVASGPASGGSSARHPGDAAPHATPDVGTSAGQRPVSGRSGSAGRLRHSYSYEFPGGVRGGTRGRRPSGAARPGLIAGRSGEPAGRLWSRLTARDRTILALLEAHRVLTTDQLWRLEFDSLRRAQQRMSELYELGVVWRFRYPLLGGGSQPWHYALGYQGARLQAAQRGEDPPRPQAFAAKLERLAESPKLAHLLGVNDFFSALAGHARHRKGRGGRMARADGLQVWLSEQQVAKRYAESLSYIQSSRWDVRPDGFGEWQEGGRTLAFYLEYDTGTETLPRVADKVKSYVGDSDVFAPNLHGMILFWLHSSRREQGLRAELIRHPTTMPIATAAADYGDPAGPAGPVWLPLVHPLYGKPTRITLGQLPHAIGGTEPNGTPTVLANLRRARDDVTPRQW